MSKMFVKNLFLQFLGLIAVLGALFGCSEPKSAGTVTDTGNTVAQVTGVVHRSNGDVASNAVVRMARRVNADDSLTIPEMLESLTDTAGVFAFDSAIADTFQLAVIDSAGAEVFYMPKMTAKSEDLDSLKMGKAAVFSSVLQYEDVADPEIAVGSHFIVYLTGTPFYQSVFAGDSFSVLIPKGTWWMEFFPGDPQIVAKLQSSGVADSLIYRTWKMDSEVDAGDTLEVRPFIWSTTAEVDSLVKETEEAAKDVSRLYGEVACKNGKPCEGVEVSLITDLYGFNFTEGDSLEFEVLTKTDSLGRWWLNLPKEVPEDSFRVEYRKVQDDIVVQTGTSRYVLAKEIKELKDTLNLGSDTLTRPSAIVTGVTLVIDREDTTQSSNCMVNSVVVGIKGTSHFVRDATCNLFTLADLPAGEQEIVLYSGIPKVISVLEKSDAPRWTYVSLTEVSLPENAKQEVQWMTYTPPSQNIFE